MSMILSEMARRIQMFGKRKFYSLKEILKKGSYL